MTSEKKTKKKNINFEKSLEALEDLVEEMENGDLTLEESLSKFEKGIQLTKDCQSALQSAQQRVNILLEKNGEPSLDTFEEES